jgi:sugar fermentation stimulation protein A
VVQRTDCDAFSACRELDPKFADALEQAADAGVEVLVYGTSMATSGISLSTPLPWRRLA